MHDIATNRRPDDFVAGDAVETIAIINMAIVDIEKPVKRRCRRPNRRVSGREHNAMDTLMV